MLGSVLEVGNYLDDIRIVIVLLVVGVLLFIYSYNFSTGTLYVGKSNQLESEVTSTVKRLNWYLSNLKIEALSQSLSSITVSPDRVYYPIANIEKFPQLAYPEVVHYYKNAQVRFVPSSTTVYIDELLYKTAHGYALYILTDKNFNKMYLLVEIVLTEPSAGKILAEKRVLCGKVVTANGEVIYLFQEGKLVGYDTIKYRQYFDDMGYILDPVTKLPIQV